MGECGLNKFGVDSKWIRDRAGHRREDTKMREGLEQLCYQERLREMEKRRLRRSPSVSASTCRGAEKGTKPCTSAVIPV